MKSDKIKIAVILVAFAGLLVSQCKHDDTIVPVKGTDATKIIRGTEALNCTNCTPLVSNGASSDFSTTAVPSGVWYFDKSHANVTWETPYKGVGSLLNGRFNYFVLKDLSFDEQDPTKISFEGYVRLNTVNTGEPGRDAGCLLGTFNTSGSKTSEAENIATIKSTSVALSTTDAGYIANANFTFLGVTKSVVVKLYYDKQSQQTGTPNYTMAGLYGEFEFNALSDYLVNSNNISDKVLIRMNVLLRKKD
ncbi:MAG: YceI family protein [Cytophagales bacterium]|nr:YceI family protein [Cytophagales bacterium]